MSFSASHTGIKMTPELTRVWLSDKTFRQQTDVYQAAHPNWPGAVGLEIEMLPLVIGDDAVPKLVPLQGEYGSLAGWLREIACGQKWETQELHEDGHALLMTVLLNQGDNLSFEPGGQLEFSSRPYGCLTEAISRTIEVQKILDRELKRLGDITLTQIGLNPWHSVEQIGLQMTKPRYRAMNEYFSAISEYGPRMMRQTCTVQVNLDFGRTERDMAKRYLASQLIAPFTGAVFNYSGVSSGKPVGMTGLRSKIWRHMDPTRTGVLQLDRVYKNLTKEACVDSYYDFVMNARVVFVQDLDYRVIRDKLTWADWMKNGVDGVYPTDFAFETHMSLLFPEVRARGFLELRSVDCQARVWQFVPAAWWAGLLYDSTSCDMVIDLLYPLASKMTELLDAAPFGLTNPILNEYSKKLLRLAVDGLSRLPSCYFEDGSLRTLEKFGEHFISRGRVPAQDILDEVTESGFHKPSTYRRVEERWNKIVL
jgi:glutamate--cysteine ligase